jgi:DNA repair protein RadC
VEYLESTDYRLRIKDLPDDERPYEKMSKYGAEVLSNAELLAIIIKTGTRDDTSVGLAQKLLKHDGTGKGLSFLYDMTLKDLMAIKGIGRVKAIQIKALLEFSKRVACFVPQEGYTVKSPVDVAQLLMEEMRYLKQESFRIILLSVKNHVIKQAVISVGSLTASIVHPREVFAEAIRHSSASIILAHNHPSGDPTPSREDIETTERLCEAGKILGISVLDHIIIGNGKFISLKEKGLM